MSFESVEAEVRKMADEAYECVEWQVAYEEQPYAVVNLENEEFVNVRELVPLFTVVGETEPAMRTSSVTWGSDQDLEKTFLERFYEAKSGCEVIPDNQAKLIARLFLNAKQEYLNRIGEAPEGSVSLLGMLAIYSFTRYEGKSDTGDPATFFDWLSNPSSGLTYSPVDAVSAKLIAPRAFTQSVMDASPLLREEDRPFNQPNLESNASAAEMIVLATLISVCAPGKYLHPHIKEVLFS